MRCLSAGYEERRQWRQRRRWRCCGGVWVQVAVVHVHADGVHDNYLRGGLRPVARPVQVPEPAQDETAGVPTARAQRQRVLHHGKWPSGGPDPAQRLQVHGAGAQLQRGHRVQRRRRYRCWPTDDTGKSWTIHNVSHKNCFFLHLYYCRAVA